MRKFIIFFSLLTIFSCNSRINKLDRNDFIIVDIQNNPSIVLSNYNLYYLTDEKRYVKIREGNKQIFKDKNILVFSQKWVSDGMSSANLNNNYMFTNEKDTMNISCNGCGQQRNFHYTNFHFKKGNYILYFSNPGKEIKGNKIENLKHSTINNDLKKMNFIEVDLADTINVKLKPIYH